MAHKQPRTGVWDLAMRSQILWQLLADMVQNEGFDPLEALGWKKTGSSRQFTGFNTELDMFIINCVRNVLKSFFPALKHFSLEHLSQKMNVGIGLHPYMPDGRPVIGPVPSMPNVILATCYEGGGLSMALGTAEMVTDMVLENPLRIDCKHFSLED